MPDLMPEPQVRHQVSSLRIFGMIQKIPVHYLKEDSEFDAEVTLLRPSSERCDRLNGFVPHIDDCFTLVVVAKGCGTTDIDFRTVSLSAGQLGIIAPGQVHSNICVKECEAWMLRISPDMMDNDYRHLIDEYSMTGDAVVLSEETMKMLCDSMELLSRLIASMKDARPMKSVVFNMLNVILGIITPMMLTGQSRPLFRTTEIAVRFKRMLPKFVRRQKSPSFYANELCISERYLSEAVKKSTGMTPTEWISSAIILDAKRLLRSTTSTVKEIAHELGFEDHAYFSRLFKKVTGMTPLEFRGTNLK